jgi:shikimate dehydrogenase
MRPSAPRLGVLGWPVAHSRSPAIQNAALRAVGLSDWRYQLLPAPPELLGEIVGGLPAVGFRGANVTIPHKAAALALADRATDAAAAIGAANTLVFEDGAVFADNTDAPAVIDALPFPAAGRSALVLGAGGSARAVVWALLRAGARDVRVWNRTPERARALVDDLGGTVACGAQPADILVNCTSSGLDSSAPMFKELPLDADDVTGYDSVVDLVYTDTGTDLVRAARERGVFTVDGLDILVRQGALSFERFTGVEAPVDVMHAAARTG